jgi:hypothetical protein
VWKRESAARVSCQCTGNQRKGRLRRSRKLEDGREQVRGKPLEPQAKLVRRMPACSDRLGAC